MSETDTAPLTVKAARKLLNDTRGRSSEEIAAAHSLLHDLRSKKPGYLPGGGMCVVTCKACGCAGWSLHTDGDDEKWGCDNCHREPMSAAEAKALRDARAAQEALLAAEAKAVADAAPKPRQALSAVATELSDARAMEARLGAAAAAGRDQLATARTGLDNAEAELTTARERIARGAVDALLDPSSTGKKPKTVASELASVTAAGSELELAHVAAKEIEDRLADARTAVRRLEQRHREAALTVLSDETAPLLIARATEARTEFVAASKGLRWLERAGAAPTSLIAAELRWSWQNLPQNWTSGEHPGPDLDTALAALLRDPRASVGEWA